MTLPTRPNVVKQLTLRRIAVRHPNKPVRWYLHEALRELEEGEGR